MRVAALLLLVRYLREASDDAGSLERPFEAVASIEASVAPARRHRFEAQRAAFEHGLQPIDAAIALFQALGPTEAVARAVAHAELFEAAFAAWCIVDQPELLASGSALRAAKIGPRSAVPKDRMSDADEFVLLAERYEDLPVLKSNRARGLEARYADADKLVEEDAVVRVASAFRHELEAALRIRLKVRYRITTHFPRRLVAEANGDRVWGPTKSTTARELVPGCGSPIQCRARAGRPESARS